MPVATNIAFRHRFVPGTDLAAPPLLLLLHGTVGNEDDLLPLGRAVSPGSALLSPRGMVLEGGMPRLFRRLAEGVFDEGDLRRTMGARVWTRTISPARKMGCLSVARTTLGGIPTCET